MEFWGVEVKAGEPLKVQPEFGKLIHISQAALGEVKDVEGAKCVRIHLKIGGKDLILGALSAENHTQLMFDLVFEKEFELSHNWKDGSLYFMGYIADDPVSDGEDLSDEFDDEMLDQDLMNAEANAQKSKAKAAANAKAGALVNGVKKQEDSSSDDEDSDDSDDSESGSDDEDLEEGMEDDSSSEEDEPEPVETKENKKRPAESAKLETPAKKAKPAKAGDKSAGKTPNANKSTPKSTGQVSCKSCPKTFSSEKAMESHSKAKHAGK